jgi:REP element-mobilizing transposase RayT
VANKLRRYYGAGYLHFITTSCYRRLPLLEQPQHRDLLLEVIERARLRYQFVVVGYVIMPEHMHLLLSEPARGDPSKVMQAIKQGFARHLLRQRRAGSDPRQSPWDTALDRAVISGKRVFMTLWYTRRKSGWRSCAICIATR